MQTSFDSFLPNGSSVTAEPCGSNCWSLYLLTPDGLSRLPLGRVMGNRDEAMIKADAIADALTAKAAGGES